ncbi:alpha/beta hydrolase [Paludibacterium purpuratum]|uniref:Acetyl esterase/lipase n=1 Tax=Paludibacterium purpuratum TaxID=1144873 RepID=A0A4V3DVL2_9NEIS|nr:alpha/beta hydrolase [Paludibacterium purpuratum]TDR81409.1 acetyl esterase/lipase [Paludibacterium purpuratum]
MAESELNPQLADWLNAFNQKVAQMLANGYKPTAIGAREALAGVTRQLVSDGPAIAWVNDDLIAGRDYAVPVRIYHPAPGEARPVLLYLHGGGHTAGSVSVYDPISRRLAAATGHIVMVPEYRLAPENPYPAAVLDAYTAAKGAFALLQTRQLTFTPRLALAGDSAGAALAATLSARLQYEPDVPLARQVLLYPCLDYTMSAPSMDQKGLGYFLTRARIAWYFEQYFQHGEDRRAVSPLHLPIGSGMPATLIVSAGFDPLCDEATHYLQRLQTAGVAVEQLHHPDMLHAFLNMEQCAKAACDQTYRRIAEFLDFKPAGRRPHRAAPG